MKIKDDLLDVLEGMLVRLKDMNPLKSNKEIDYVINAWDHNIKFYLAGIEISDSDIYEIIYTIQHIYNFLENYGFNVIIKVINENYKEPNDKIRKEIKISELEDDLLSKKYQKYRIGVDRQKGLDGSIIIIFEETDRCYNHIYPKGSKMLDGIGGYNSIWNKKFKSIGEVGNFNESKSDKLTPSQVKFFELKDIEEDLHGMLVELDDEQIYYSIEPNDFSNISKLAREIVSNNFRNYFSVLIGPNLYRNKKHIDLIYDRIGSIVSYMKIKGYETSIRMKNSLFHFQPGIFLIYQDNKLFLNSKDFEKKNFEIFFYKHFKTTDYVLLKFTPSTEVNESLLRHQTVDQLKNDLISKEYKTYAKNPIIISFKETDRCYNHIYPKGSKMLDGIGGYNSTYKKLKSVGEVGNFNESKSDKLTPTQVKFFELKDIIEDLYGMLVELDDEQIYYAIEPRNEIQLRTMTLLDNFRNIDFSVLMGNKLYRNLEHIDLIYDRIGSIVSYMKIKGYETSIRMKTLLKMRSDNLKFDEMFEIFFYKYFNNTDYVLLKFTPSTEVNESLPRQQTVDQLKKVMKQSTKTDIGNRISDMNKQGANIDYIRNPIDSGIESYEDFEKHNKKFVPSWNLKHLIGPFAPEPKPKVHFNLDYKKKQDKKK